MELNNGNKFAWNVLQNMAKNNRPAHGVLFYGEEGVGKKYIAEEYAMSLMCTDPDKNKRPCGKCKACQTVKNHTNPDVFWAEKTGKLGTISAGSEGDGRDGTVRDLRSKLYEYPEGRNKILIFADCKPLGSWSQAQNMLLKILEEPPEYGYIIFTATEKEIFIKTILSRIISLQITRPTIEQTKKILQNMEIEKKDIEEAVNVYGGNIGKCLKYITDISEREKISSIENFVKSIVFKREYDALATLKNFYNSRDLAMDFLNNFENVLRDGLILSNTGNLDFQMGCSKKSAEILAENISSEKIEKMYEIVKTAQNALQANIRAEFVLTAFVAETFS